MSINDKQRLDKWLWAARFFKTRALAKKAIEGGKVHYGGQRCKVSKQIAVGDILHIRQGNCEKEVEILQLCEQRKGAPEAQTLYCESAASVQKRQQQEQMRKHAYASLPHIALKPNKKQRRDLLKFKQTNTEN